MVDCIRLNIEDAHCCFGEVLRLDLGFGLMEIILRSIGLVVDNDELSQSRSSKNERLSLCRKRHVCEHDYGVFTLSVGHREYKCGILPAILLSPWDGTL